MNATSNSEALTNQMMENMREPFVMLVSQGLLSEIPQQKMSPAEQKRLKSEADESAQRIMEPALTKLVGELITEEQKRFKTR